VPSPPHSSPPSRHPPGDAPRRVSLFVTCLTEAFYPRAAIAVVKVLEHLGCVVDFPRDQTCCGQPMYNNGLHPEAAVLARRMIGVFEHADAVVTPSGSCAAMVHHFPELLAGDGAWHGRAQRLADRTFEFSQFLLDVLHVDPGSIRARWDGHAAYHPSCHLRTIGMHTRAEIPLRQVEGLRVTALDNAEQCCGFGGAFSIKQPDLSASLARDKVAALERAGTPTLVCNDAGCAMNIEGACRRARTPVRVLTTAEIIAEGLGLLPGNAETGA
jgi:L-lactate dehydrogenase complex protein LldE